MTTTSEAPGSSPTPRRGAAVPGRIGPALLALSALLAGAEAAVAADPASSADGGCMEVTDTVIASYATLSFTGFILGGGTGRLETSPGPRCRGAYGDIHACGHAGRAYPPGAVIVRENPRGAPVASVCRNGIWE